MVLYCFYSQICYNAKNPYVRSKLFMKNLIIVESPAKARTITNFLSKEYKVIASKGHIRDLPKSTFGITQRSYT